MVHMKILHALKLRKKIWQNNLLGVPKTFLCLVKSVHLSKKEPHFWIQYNKKNEDFYMGQRKVFLELPIHSFYFDNCWWQFKGAQIDH